ncbi:pyruvate kinase [Nitrospina watsonii]|uniref:Pyruvate kinase n=1 Tax=Nitrospina watsonii TaxID=1323948 RepID=A0ABM9HB22_9BACT|nr:pyruvate kinase [Nitrospina watsonii]CAI2717307.1 pyruvate kinase [Nitrospina watsonii]
MRQAGVRLTKIIATLGPATGTRKQIKALAVAGVNIFRLNLSHGDHAVLRQWIHWIRRVEKELHTHLGILFDLQGPKIRVGKFEGGYTTLHSGQKVTFTTEKVTGEDGLVPVQFKKFHETVKKGDSVFLDDGNIYVQVLSVSGKRVEMKVQVGGRLADHKGINLPDSVIPTGALTAKDKKDLQFGLEEEIDFVALSFASSAEDIRRLRHLIQRKGKDAEIIAKIERKKAVRNLESIVAASDAVMVARGDLGIEIPLTEVPVVQQRILNECARQAKPVIVATQMMESMITNPRPTRAETSDISNAVMSKTDAIMLSAETAVGRHPITAVQIMAKTVETTEAFLKKERKIQPWNWFLEEEPPISLGITYSANHLAEVLHARMIVVFTLTGGTAKMIRSPNPMVPLAAFTSKRARARQLTLLRGALPFLVEADHPFLGNMKELFQRLKQQKLVKEGDRIVITAGDPPGVPSWTNVIRVERVP